jgi:hypothetical protein
LYVTGHLSKNDAEVLGRGDTPKIGIFMGSLEYECESSFAESRESLLVGAGIYAQERRKLLNWLNMFGRAPTGGQGDG